MIRGIHIPPVTISVLITSTVLFVKALSKFTEHPLVSLIIYPSVVFVLLLIAVLLVFYPHIKGKKAIIMGPVLVTVVGFVVYAIYVI